MKVKTFDFVIYNTKEPAPALLKKYADEGELVRYAKDDKNQRYKAIGANLLSERIAKRKKGDSLGWQRALIRHNADKLARVISEL